MRRHTRFFILACAGVFAVGAGTSPPPAAQRREPAPGDTALTSAIAEIEAGRRTTPLIGEPTAGGGATVTFLAQRRGRHVPRIVSDVTGWGEHTDGTFDFTAGSMKRVAGTAWYSLQANVAPRARIEYLIAYAATDFRTDPHNPRRSAGPQFGGAPASEFVMPGYVPPPEFADPPISPAGLTSDATVESRLLRGSYRLVVYTPVGYRDDGAYPTAVFLDSRSAQVSRVLDWLIAHEAIEPIVAVFVVSNGEGGDSGRGAPMREFLTDELPPWLASRYGVTRSAGKRAIIGISYGARDALDAAGVWGAVPGTADAPERQTSPFGRVGLLIPGRRITRADLDAIAERRTHRLQVAIMAGEYDHANVATARGLRQALAGAGHVVDYTEVPEGHSAVTWTHHLRTVLVSLFGRGRSGP